MPLPNDGLYCLKPHLFSYRIRLGVLQLSVQPPPQEPPCQSPRHLFLEASQDLSHAGGNHPRLCTKEQHRLDDVLRENPDTRGLAPSLISILDIICHIIRAFTRFWTTSGQSSSAAYITLPRYLNYFTVSRGNL